MRLLLAVVACGALLGCTSGAVTVPNEPAVLYEVPPAGSASSAGGPDDFTARIESALNEPAPGGGVPPGATVQGSPDGTGRALDDDQINLMQWTLEQQKIDAAIAERELLDARSQLVIVQPGPLPPQTEGVNIALFARQTTHQVGERRYDRPFAAGMPGRGNCGRFRDADAAQRAFLAGGGPERDRYGLDPDGDGFACRWDPTPYRSL